jgi:hypothetical protein
VRYSNGLSPAFETKFARREYVGNDEVNRAFVRHTGRWVELYKGLAVDARMTALRADPWFVL